MFDESLITLSKIVSLAIFVPIYTGAVVYAFWKPNKAKFDHYATIPFQED